MFFVDLLFAFILAVFLSLILTAAFGWRRHGEDVFFGSLLFVFLLIFLAAWAGGVWLPPFGPVLWGSTWLPFLVIAFFVALLVLALAPPRPPRTRREAAEQAREEASTATALGVFFWVFVIGLGIAILIRYVV